MGFLIKTWKNRLAQYPFRRQLTKLSEGVDGNNNPIYVMDVQRAEGTVSEAGDMFSADTMNDLENRINLAFAETLPKLSSMPTASADNVDTQVMYVGATDSNYIKGHCYECRESSGNYSWVHIGVVDVTVDSSLSTTSTNPVENRKITNAVSAALGKIADTDLNNDNKASYPHAKDDWLIYGTTENPLFGQCQAAIATGETFNYGTGGNITNTKVSDVLTQLNNELNAQHRRKRGAFTPSGLRQCITSDGVDLSIMGYSIGDEYQINANYKAVIADIDTFYGGYNSYAVVNSHHVGLLIVGKAGTVTSKWNNSNSTSSGYNGSVLHTTLKGLISTIESALGTLISHQKLLTTATSNWAWQADQKISALTESQIYGAPICSIDFYQQGEACRQLEVFRKFSFNEIFGSQSIWLRSAQSASGACYVDYPGHASTSVASGAGGVVGLVLFH